jgi:thioredoxin reductase (NADPH)
MEEAIFLTRFASKVTVIHRRDHLRASKVMQARAFANPKIEFIWDTVVDDVLGEQSVSGLTLRNLKTGAETVLPVSGVFVAIGHHPNTDLFAGQIDTDAQGYITVVPDTTLSSVPGVFAAGDVHDTRYKQAITAAGDGCKAAIDAERYLEEHHLGEEIVAEVAVEGVAVAALS